MTGPHSKTELVAAEAASWLVCLVGIETIRIHNLVAIELEHRAVQLVGSGTQRVGDDAATGSSILWRVGVGKDACLMDGIHSGNAAILIVIRGRIGGAVDQGICRRTFGAIDTKVLLRLSLV